MSVRDFQKEQNKELFKHEYQTKNKNNFLNFINKMSLEIEEYDILKATVYIEVEGIKISDDEVFFP